MSFCALVHISGHRHLQRCEIATAAFTDSKKAGDRIVPGTSDWNLVEIDPNGIDWMQSKDDSMGTLWMLPTLYERIKLDSLEPPRKRKIEETSPPGKDTPNSPP